MVSPTSRPSTPPPQSHVHAGGCCNTEAPKGQVKPEKPTSFFQTWEQVALLGATIFLSYFAFKKNPTAAAAGLVVGVGLAAIGDRIGLGVTRLFSSASGGCSGALGVLSQSTVPPIIGVPAFIAMQKAPFRAWIGLCR